MRGGMHKKLDVLQSLFSSKAGLCCLVETWQTENCTPLGIPGYSRHSVCRPVKQRGPIRGGICVYVAAHLSLHVKVWRVAADSSYVWLRLSHVKVNGYGLPAYLMALTCSLHLPLLTCKLPKATSS